MMIYKNMLCICVDYVLCKRILKELLIHSVSSLSCNASASRVSRSLQQPQWQEVLHCLKFDRGSIRAGNAGYEPADRFSSSSRYGVPVPHSETNPKIYI